MHTLKSHCQIEILIGQIQIEGIVEIRMWISDSGAVVIVDHTVAVYIHIFTVAGIIGICRRFHRNNRIACRVEIRRLHDTRTDISVVRTDRRVEHSAGNVTEIVGRLEIAAENGFAVLPERCHPVAHMADIAGNSISEIADAVIPSHLYFESAVAHTACILPWGAGPSGTIDDGDLQQHILGILHKIFHRRSKAIAEHIEIESNRGGFGTLPLDVGIAIVGKSIAGFKRRSAYSVDIVFLVVGH